MQTLRGKIVAFIVVIVIIAGAYAIGAGDLFAPEGASAATVLYDQDTVTTVYENASPAVFLIQTQEELVGNFGFPVPRGLGSGFLIDDQGHILTNNHVVAGASGVTVMLDGGDMVEAEVLGTDEVDDLAVIGIDPSLVSGITPLQLEDSGKVRPGQMAIAMGNPYGLDDTITIGIISGLNRNVTGTNLRGMIQTDAALNPGNSGGPLLDVNGKVIGINTAIESTSASSRGIGFAIPSNVVRNVLPDLVAGKSVSRPWLGISGRAITGPLAEELGLPVDRGIYVITVNDDSPAEKAGIRGSNLDEDGNPARDGDIITAVDSQSIGRIEDLSGYILNKKVGDTIRLTVLRDNNSLSIQATLEPWPAGLTSGIIPEAVPTPTPGATPSLPGWSWRFFR